MENNYGDEDYYDSIADENFDEIEEAESTDDEELGVEFIVGLFLVVFFFFICWWPFLTAPRESGIRRFFRRLFG